MRWIFNLICGLTNAYSDDLLLTLRVNHKECPDVGIVKQDGENLIIGHDLLKQCKVNPEGVDDPLVLSPSSSMTHTLNIEQLSLDVTVPESWISNEFYDASPTPDYEPTEKTYALGMNYDATISHVPKSTLGNFLPEGFIYTPLGIIRSSHLVTVNQNQKPVRLETYFTSEIPEWLAQFTAGDTYSRASSWSPSIRMAGLKFARNFDIQSNYIYYPLPSISGSSAVPSAIDVFANSSRIFTGDVKSGPYTISNLPVVNGAGNLSLETVDLLGRKVTIDTPYYVSSSLLKSGMHDFSYEAGMIRDNFGLKSNDYTQPAVVVTHRYGLTNQCTIAGHAENTKSLNLLGGDLSQNIFNLGIARVAYAKSHSHLGSGNLLQWAFDRQANPISLGARVTQTTPLYRDISNYRFLSQTKVSLQSYISYNMGDLGSVSLSFTSAKPHTSNVPIKFITLSYSKSFENGYALTVSALKSTGAVKDLAFQIGLNKLFDDDLFASTNISRDKGNNRQSFGIQKSFNGYHGTMYRANITRDTGSFTGDSNILNRNAYGDLGIYASKNSQSSIVQASSSGSAIYSNEAFGLSRKIQSSIGIVKTGESKDVRVRLNNQDVGTTNNSGNLIIPNISPHTKNQLSIEPADISLSSSLHTEYKDLYPDKTGAYLVDFGILDDAPRQVKVILPDQSPVPVGTVISWSNKSETVIGLDGEAYISKQHANLIGSADCNCQIKIPNEVFNETNLPTITCTH